MTTASLIIFSIHYPQLSSHWTSVSVTCETAVA